MMKMKRRLLAAILCGIMTVLPIQTVYGSQVSQDINVVDEQGTLIEHTEADTKIMPDKYNTGCTGDLTTVVMDTENDMIYNGVKFVAGSNATNLVMDFAYRNKEVSGTVYFENYDFSAVPVVVYNEDKVERQIKIVFNNCKFSNFGTGRGESNLSYEFNNCTMNRFYGSNAVFNHCQFGESYSDGMIPFVDIDVNNCFFKDMGKMVSGGEVHTDGTQIYGHAGLDVRDVNFNNCRFAIPPLRPEGSTAYVNACIMLQLEFSNGKDISFNDCTVNGGGCSIYVTNKGDYSYENVTFDGIRFGVARKYSPFYSYVNPDVTIKDVAPTDSLYVGSVWKENGETHFSVTNDTGRERTLQIYTNNGEYTYTIPACPTGSSLTSDMVYADMPFDIDIVVPADCLYAVCFDTTLSGASTQIRFVNWSGSDVYLPDDVISTMYSGKNDILISGSCGKNVTFTLTKDGVLTLSGTGSTYNYHSAKFPEWNEYADYIKEVRVEEGVEGLGSMIFRSCVSIRKVTLPDSLTGMGQYAFGGCVGLTEFTIPANVTTLGKYVFQGTVLNEIHYDGLNWNNVEVGDGNDNLMERLVCDKQISFATSFIERMYTVALGRPADEKGLAFWVNELVTGNRDGAAVAKGFVLSPEMERRNLTNEQFVITMYQTFFNRTPADNDSGKAFWINLLENGVSRAYVFRGFCHSAEFQALCDTYGITRGTITLYENRDKNHNITMYVYRCYERTLNRQPDTSGLNFWTGVILKEERTPVDVAGNFVFSKEFKAKNVSNEEYIKILYRMFFDREADVSGFNFWLEEMNSGRRDRYKVFTQFGNSAEFKAVLAKFGL